MIQSDKLAYLTDLSGSRGRARREAPLTDQNEEREAFRTGGVLNSYDNKRIPARVSPTGRQQAWKNK